MLLFSGSSTTPAVGHGTDFIAVELADGRPRYIFDAGGGPRELVVTQGSPINDGRWHSVQLIRADITTPRGHALVVDGTAAYDVGQATTTNATSMASSSDEVDSTSSGLLFFAVYSL